MSSNKVKNFFSYLINQNIGTVSLTLESIEYSKFHDQEVCVMQLVGKNAFPKFTPAEILNSPKMLVGLSAQDAVTIAQLDEQIKKRKNQSKILEVHTNGSVVLKNSQGKIKRYAEKLVSQDPQLISSLPAKQAHDLGYRVGFQAALSIHKQKKQLKNRFKNTVRKWINPG